MPRPIARRRRPSFDSAGYSLVEVVVALLISCIMVGAILGVAMTSKQSTVKAMRRMMFDQGISQLSGQLKQYVTACGCNKDAHGGCGTGCTVISGPNTNFPNDAKGWFLNNSGPAQVIKDNQGNVYALACGAHKVTGIVPTLEAAPYLGGITYTVNWPLGCSGVVTAADVPTITFAANWTEP